MDKTAMDSSILEQGQAILAALDRADLDIKVALWASLREYDEWRLILASPQLDLNANDGACEDVLKVLNGPSLPRQQHPAFLIFRMDDPFTRAIRKRYARFGFAEGFTVGPELFGDQYVESGFVYRIC